MNQELTNLNIDFSPESLFVLNLAIAFIMFGVALGIKKSEFIEIKRNPKSVAVGVISQFILLPLFTFLVVLLIKPLPELALGMILVAASPGGNVSNFFSQQSKGNIALSVSLTAIASISAVFMTPFNFDLYANLYAQFSGQMAETQIIEMQFFDILKKVLTILIIPLVLGLWFANRYAKLTEKVKGPIGTASFVILMLIIIIGFANNVDIFLAYYQHIIVLVLLHNGVSFAVGYGSGKIAGLPGKDTRTITIETGIQNSGLALAIIFSVFNGNGGMALLAAWWGIWHIISGTTISYFFRRANKKSV